MDFDRLKADNRLSESVARAVTLTKDGHEFRALCPFHEEKTPSFTVNDAKGFYHCFGCGAHGDVVDFVGAFYRLTAAQAAAVLSGQRERGFKTTKAAIAARAAAEPSIYATLKPGMTHAEPPTPGVRFVTYNPKRERFGSYIPKLVHPYVIDGKLQGIVIRAEIDGVKLTPQLRWARIGEGDDARDVWCHWPFDEPRPLYIRRPEKPGGPQVIVVEGEKAADAAYRLFGDLTVVTWAGGTNAPHKSSWAAVAGKKLVLWPDNDKPGVKAMNAVAAIALKAGAKSVKIIEPDTGKSEGWDAADAEAEGWDRTKLLTWASGRAKPFTQTENAPGRPGASSTRVQRRAPKASADPGTPLPPDEVPGDNTRVSESAPCYECLGFSDDPRLFFVRPNGTESILALSHAQLATPSCLVSIYQQKDWWATQFPSPNAKTGGIDVIEAASDIMRACHARGRFSLDRVRGVGAWRDAGRTIINLGDRAVVDGVTVSLSKIRGRYTYARRDPIEVGDAEPATLAQSRELLRICSALNWEDKLSGRLLAGWVVSAAVCGALDWRPHIWVTGGPGTGKSTVVNLIAKPMLGELAVTADGPSSAAGIRQTLRYDAKALFLDEFESRPSKQGDHVQDVLDLLRGASSGSKIRKGTSAGAAIEFEIRTAACFSSINPGVSEKADEDRISRLNMRRRCSRER
jgi:putative DNA primase/helicase